LAKPNPLGAVAAGILMFVIGLVIGGFAIELARSDQERLAAAWRAQGTVTGELNGRPLVAFTLPNGDRVSFTATSVARNEYRVGHAVDVLYRPDLPSDAVIDRPRARWTRNALLGVAAAAMMALGAYVAWYARNYDARRAG
jgi:hypothetical protein